MLFETKKLKACCRANQHPSRYQRGHWYSFDGRTNNSRGLSFRNGLEATPRLAGVVTTIPLPPYFLRGDKQYDNVFLIVARFVEKTFCSFCPALHYISTFATFVPKALVRFPRLRVCPFVSCIESSVKPQYLVYQYEKLLTIAFFLPYALGI